MGTQDSVKTVLIPAAGLGTRMLPATKAFPKELLPIVDRPIIQYGVEEAANAGIDNVVLITNPGNTLAESHFARNQVLEHPSLNEVKTTYLPSYKDYRQWPTLLIPILVVRALPTTAM